MAIVKASSSDLLRGTGQLLASRFSGSGQTMILQRFVPWPCTKGTGPESIENGSAMPWLQDGQSTYRYSCPVAVLLMALLSLRDAGFARLVARA